MRVYHEAFRPRKTPVAGCPADPRHIRFFFLLSGWLLWSGYCQAQHASGYEVSGDIAGLASGSTVYLINGSQRKIIDSATVTQGQFTLRGHLAEPAHMYLHAGRGPASKKLADILLDNQTVQVQGSAPAYEQVTVRGSAIDQQWKDWLQEDQTLAQQRATLKKEAASWLAKNDTARANALQQRVAGLQVDRVNVLKAYVQRYHDTAAGAALPTMCTLGASLTGNDYVEMYRVLTPRWQHSSFGKEIMTQATKKGGVQK